MEAFDLEKAIVQLLKRLNRYESVEPGYIEEIKAHLFDKIDSLKLDGLTEEQAFSKASESVVANIEEIASEYHKVHSRKAAKPSWEKNTASLILFPSYLKIPLRNLSRNKTFSFINISGLAIGLGCCLLITLYVMNELDYDKHHPHPERLYRAYVDREEVSSSRVDPTIANALLTQFPEIEQTLRITRKNVTMSYGQNRFNESSFFYADPSVFDLFSFPLLQGDSNKALTAPYTVVITSKMAHKYFGSENPVGKDILITDNFTEQTYTVTGVLDEIVKNSHFEFDFLASFATFGNEIGADHGFAGFGWTYVRMQENYDLPVLEKTFNTFWQAQERKRPLPKNYRLRFQQVTDIHLHSNLSGEITPNSDIQYVYIFSFIALLTLGIACINYINLATARAVNRAREVGVRKTAGARQVQLVTQFMGESMLISIIAIFVAVFAGVFALPYFNDLIQKELIFQFEILLPTALGIAILVGLFAGSYPAFFLSSFKPVVVLKGFSRSTRSMPLRSTLVAFQFAISIGLIISTLVINGQLSFIQQKQLGFNKEQVLAFSLSGNIPPKELPALKNELLKYSGISQVSSAFGSAVDMKFPRLSTFEFESKKIQMQDIIVGYDYLETLQIELLEGRGFSSEFPADVKNAVILNKAAVEALEWKDPIGRQIPIFGDERTVVGVVDDFHYASLHEKIEPAVLYMFPQVTSVFFARFEASDIQQVLAYTQEVWNKFVPNRPFEYSFLDSDYEAQYQTEQRLGDMVSSFSVLAILIACLGLFGLVSFTTEQRTKEIGIRKILGASVAAITLLITKGFIRLVLVAFLIAAPIAYLVMQRWLDDFAYSITIGPDLFFIAGIIAACLVFLTVSYQSINAATANPVNSLRSE